MPPSAGSPPAVLVIGDVMLDVVAVPRGPLESGADTPAVIALEPGGAGANVAAWLGRLGTPVIFAGRAGAESCAWHADALRAAGVEPALAVDADDRTGVLVSLVASDGERSFLTDRGANANLARGDLPDALLDRVALVHFSGYTLEQPGSRAAIRAFLAAAAARGIPITVDPGSVSLLREIGPAAFLEWTRPAQVCFPNAAEAALLAGTPDPGEALAFLGGRYAAVVIKHGAAGATACAHGGTQRWSAPAPATAARDTTGAGDAFVAGFLAAYVRRAPIGECLERAVANGARAVTQLGGRPPRANAATPAAAADRAG